MTHKIAVIAGDGIGVEVTSVALAVVRAAGVGIETVDFDNWQSRKRDPFGVTTFRIEAQV